MQELEESRLETIDMTLSKMSATLGKTNAPLPPDALAHFRKATGHISVLNDISGFAATVGCDCREPADELLPPARALAIAALRPPKDAPNGGSFWENVLWKPLRSLAESLAQPTGRNSVGQSEMLQVHFDPSHEPQCATHMPHPSVSPTCLTPSSLYATGICSQRASLSLTLHSSPYATPHAPYIYVSRAFLSPHQAGSG